MKIIALTSTAMCVAVLTVTSPPAAGAGASSSPQEHLHELFQREWQRTLEEDPANATYLGERRYDDRWPDLSAAAREESHKRDQQTLAALKAIAYEQLPAADRLNYDLFGREYQDRLDSFRFHLEDYDLTPSRGIQTASEVSALMPFESAADYERWLSRLQLLPRYIEQSIVGFSRGPA